MDRKPSETQVQPGDVLCHYSEEEVSEWLAQWIDAFGKNRHGVNTKAYLWHVFSGARYPSLSGAAAVERYQQQMAVEYVVLSNDRKVAFSTNLRPERCMLSDYYVFPLNLAWSMAFTHEDGWLGPYFAVHADFAQLDEVNRAKLQKVREAELAKKKGWC